jgi:hypothetical protein
MGKKKKVIDLSSQEITYGIEGGSVKVVRFDPNRMSVDINIYAENENVRSATIPFAQLPKAIKQRVRPL